MLPFLSLLIIIVNVINILIYNKDNIKVMRSGELFQKFSISPVVKNIDPIRPHKVFAAMQRYSLANTTK